MANEAEQPGQTPAPEPSAGRGIERFEIFEKVALERLQAGSDSTKAASFLPLPVRATAIAAAGIAGLGVLWSIFARVPVQVNGTAAIVAEGGMSSIVAGTNGQLLFQVSGLAPDTLPAASQRNNALISAFWKNDAIALSKQVQSMESLSELVRAALSPIRGQELFLPEYLEGQEAIDTENPQQSLVHYKAGTVLARIVDSIANQELNEAWLTTQPANAMQQSQSRDRLRRADEYTSIGESQRRQIATLQAELKQRKDLYQRLQALWKKGYVPATQLLNEQATINSIESQLLNATSNKLSIKMNARDQVDQSKQDTINNLNSRSQLELQLTQNLAKTTVFAPPGGIYIIANNFDNNAIIRQGEELLNYSTIPPALPKDVPVFMDAASAQQVNEGMGVLLTPKGISRAEFGGIRGKVDSVIKLPLLGEGILGSVGSRSLSNSIQQLLPAPYVAWVKLEQAEPKFCQATMSRRCYRWSSGRVPEHPVRLATLADVQITTGYQRPIEFVIPALKKLLGLVVDN